MTTALTTYSHILKRGTEVWLDGVYPMRVMQDTTIPINAEEKPNTMIQCTSIIAYGDSREEREYSDWFRYADIRMFKI